MPPPLTPTPTPAPEPVPDPGAGDPVAPPAAGTWYLRTRGNQIVDVEGRAVRLAGVNWFGLETHNFAPHGLWSRGYREMMNQMKAEGFNTIRLPYSDQLLAPASTPNGIDFSKNPDLQGLNGLEVMDKVVAYAGEIGLRVILDHHRSEAGNSANSSGLWYTAAYPEATWIANLSFLASRYAGSPAVIGIDLHNEPHGSGDLGRWRPQRLAAGRLAGRQRGARGQSRAPGDRRGRRAGRVGQLLVGWQPVERRRPSRSVRSARAACILRP